MGELSGLNSIFQLDFPLLVVLGIVFLAVILSSFVKIVTVFGIIRAGFGFHNVPSALVTGGFSLILSFFVMAPVISQSAAEIDVSLKDKKNLNTVDKVIALDQAGQKWKHFLSRHAHPEQKAVFAKLAAELDQSNEVAAGRQLNTKEVDVESWRVIAPAFIVSELKEAFATGLSLFLPFFIIDLVVAAVLAAVELKSLSPSLVGLPLKLLLFVVVDGWGLITANLVNTYIK